MGSARRAAVAVWGSLRALSQVPLRGRPARAPSPAMFALAWVAGCAAALGGHELCPWPMLAAAGLATFAAYGVVRKPQILILAVALAGALWSTHVARQELGARLPCPLEGRTLVVTGRVASLVRREPGRVRFRLAVTRIEDLHGAVLPRVPLIALSWYRPGKRLPQVGERWRLRVRLKRPRALADPGSFDYARWAFAQGIGAGGYVYHGVGKRLSPAGVGLGPVRARVVRAVHRALPDSRWAGLVAGLGVGARGGVTDTQWRILRATGTSHLLAISGLHLGLIAALAFLLADALARRIPRLAARVPSRLVGGAAAALAALTYAALAGFSLPTQRALVMLAVPLVALALRRRVRVATGLALAGVVVTLLSPLAVVTASFWLSFGAVAALAWGLSSVRRGRGLVRAQVVVSLGLVPLVALFFGRVSLVGPAANLVAIPVVGWLAVPAALAGALLSLLHPGWGLPLFRASASVLSHLWPLLVWLAGHGPARLAVAPGHGLMLVAAIVGAACLLAPRGLGLRVAGVALLVPLFWPSRPALVPGDFRVTVLDVGQGVAAVVRTAHHLLLVDTGPRWWGGNNAAGSVIVPFLRARHLGKPDEVMLSQTDPEHAGGLRYLRRKWPDLAVRSRARSADYPCRGGAHWRWDGVRFRVLGPASGGGSGDGGTCLLKVSGPGGSFLFPGDIGRSGERALVASAGTRLRADILLAPRYGSDTASAPAFIRAVSPQYVVFPVGYRNRYHWPSRRVTARYRGAGAALFDSAHDGAVTFAVTPGRGIEVVERYRRDHRAPWTDP